MANTIKAFLKLSFPLKIIVSVITISAILISISRFNWWRYQQNIKANTTLHKQAVDITKVPSEVKAFLNDENLLKMDESGMNIYTGDNPPNIEGTYVFKNMIIKYDPNGINYPIVTYNFTFKDQRDDNTVLFSGHSEKDPAGRTDLATGKGVFISGEGNCFSVYLDNDEKTGQCESKSAEIFSACKDKKGLVDMDQGTLWTYMSDKCPKEEYVPAGYIRIFSHKTLAPKVK